MSSEIEFSVSSSEVEEECHQSHHLRKKTGKLFSLLMYLEVDFHYYFLFLFHSSSLVLLDLRLKNLNLALSCSPPELSSV